MPSDTMTIDEREHCRLKLEKAVKAVGDTILSYEGSVRDVGDVMEHGHETSSLDEAARETMVKVLAGEFPDRDLTLLFELHPWEVKAMKPSGKGKLHFVIDEIDGTTNAKRWAAATVKEYRPHSAVCIAGCTSTGLDSLEVGAVFTIDQGELFSGLRIGRDFGRFSAYRNGDPLVIPPRKRGDSKNRILVVGYTSSVRVRKAQIEEEICSREDFVVYDGCRSSTMDLISIIRNQYDAYLDPRAVFGKDTETRLETYDVAGILPAMYACNLEISDIYGEPLTDYNWEDPLPLLVARPEISGELLETVRKIVTRRNIIPSHSAWRTMLQAERAGRKKQRPKIIGS